MAIIYIFAIIGIYYVSTKIGAFLYGIYLGLIKVRKPETLNDFDKETLALSKKDVTKFEAWYYRRKLRRMIKKTEKEVKLEKERKRKER